MGRSRRRAEGVVALLFLLLAVGFGLEGMRYPYYGPGGAGPGFLPVWTSLAGLVIGVLLLIRALRAAGTAPTPVPLPFDAMPDSPLAATGAAARAPAPDSSSSESTPRPPEGAAQATAPAPVETPIAWRGSIAVAIGLVAWALLTAVLGAPVTITLFVFAITWWLAGTEDRTGRGRLLLAGLTAVVVTLAVFLIFQVWLGVPFPAGIFGGRA